MQEINHKKGKIYYSMGEVAEMFDVNPSLLRYWEQEFDILKPHRNKKGNRLFTPKDVDNIRIIYHLLKERNMKIEVARKHIRDYRKEVDRDAEITERLMNIRAILLEIKQDLAYEGQTVDDDTDDLADEAMPQAAGDAVKSYSTGEEEGGAPTNSARETAGRTEQPADGAAAPASSRPPFEEQVLFEVAVPLELLQAGAAAADDGFESAKAAFAGEAAAGEEAPEEEPKPKVQAIEQTLF